MNREDKEFADLYYDVWCSGGNSDVVDRNGFDGDYDGRYDFVDDYNILNRELRKQKHSREDNDESVYM